MKPPSPRTVLTWLATIVVLGGLIRLALDDRDAPVALPEPEPPGAEEDASESARIGAGLRTALSGPEK